MSREMPRKFLIAYEDEIKSGKTTDIYFVRTVKILDKLGLSSTNVKMEITSGKLPFGWTWAILSGVYEALNLLEGIKLNFYIMDEGTLFKPFDDYGIRVPIGYIEGEYGRFAIYETPLLGVLCESSGVATYAAHLRYLVWDKILLSFGARRMHPAITPMIDYAAYIGGFDGVSSVLSAELLGLKPQGTMPHALIIIVGDQVKAWKAFDEVIEEDVKRIALVDTFYDEKIEAIMAAEALKDRLYGIRLDTPGSRRGSMAEIIREVRWELDIRGFKDVKIIVSGGVNHENIREYAEAGADGFGVGTSVSNAPTLDLALDIIEKEGSPIAKRGKLAGKKQVFRCENCYLFKVVPYGENVRRCPKCGGEMKPLIKKAIEDGKIILDIKKPNEVRDRVLKQLEIIRSLNWRL